MRILALGATGAIGSLLAKILADEDHDVFVTSRSERATQGNLSFLVGNAREDNFIDQVLLERWDAIIDFMVYDTQKFSGRINKFLHATDQYIFLSTGRVFASSETELEETSPRLLDVCTDAAYLATDEYALSKARQEDLLKASGSKNWTIVRPYITFGKARLQLGPLEKEDWLYRAIQGRSIVFCDALMDRETTLTDGSDVAGMMAALVGRKQALGEDFNLTSGISVLWERVLKMYLAVLAKHRCVDTPVTLLNIADFCKTTNPAQVCYDRIYNRRFKTEKISSFYDISKTKDPLKSLERRIDKQISDKTGFYAINWRNEALRDRAAREHVSLNEISEPKSKARYLAYRHLPTELIKKLRPQ